MNIIPSQLAEVCKRQRRFRLSGEFGYHSPLNEHTMNILWT